MIMFVNMFALKVVLNSYFGVRNTAKTIVIKTTRPIVKQLPERMQMPASRAIGRAWNMANAPYGINGQIATINDIVNE